MKGAIVYYSKTGSTEMIAKRFAEKTGFTSFKLEDRSSKTQPPMFATIFGFGAPLKEPLPDLKSCDTVVLMTPIWAWHPSAQMNTLLKKADLKDKKLFLVGVGAGDSNEKAMNRFSRSVEKKGGKIIGSVTYKGLQLKQGLKEVEQRLLESGEDLAEKISKLSR
jgi:flavodoxin